MQSQKTQILSSKRKRQAEAQTLYFKAYHKAVITTKTASKKNQN